MRDIGIEIREKRRALGLTQTDVAKACNVTYATVSSIENGISGSIKTLVSICDFLKLEIIIQDCL